jgi:hypothetical protein
MDFFMRLRKKDANMVFEISFVISIRHLSFVIVCPVLWQVRASRTG